MLGRITALLVLIAASVLLPPAASAGPVGDPATVRSRGSRGLPTAVPQRLVHRAGRQHRDRAAGGPLARFDAPQPAGKAHRPHRVEPQRRLLPRLDAAGPRPRARPRADRRGARHRHRRVRCTRRADRAPRRQHRGALAVLRRARRRRRPASPERQALIIRPAKNFLEGHRYVVGLARHEERRRAGPLEPGDVLPHATRADASRRRSAVTRASGRAEQVVRRPGPRRHRRGRPAPGVGLHRRQRAEPRRTHAAHPRRRASLARRRHARRSRSPTVTDNPDGDPIWPAGSPARSRSRTTSTRLRRPARLNRFRYGPGRASGPARQRPCQPRSCARSPVSALDGNRAAPPSTATVCWAARTRSSVRRVKAIASEHGFVFCATNWVGHVEGRRRERRRLPGRLRQLPVRWPTGMQQGILNMLFLGRAMTTGRLREPQGLPERRRRTPSSTPHDLAYDGNSQGGIIGGALTAVSTDCTHAVLGVPGMNYSRCSTAASTSTPYAADPRTRLPRRARPAARTSR